MVINTGRIWYAVYVTRGVCRGVVITKLKCGVSNMCGEGFGYTQSD